MADNIVARDLMFENFTEIRADRTLGEAMRALVEAGADAAKPNVLAVVDENGRFEGLLTARLVLKSLLTLWMPSKTLREDEMLLEEQLLSLVEERSGMRVHDALIRGLPVAAPDDRLLTLIELSCDQRLEFLAAVDGERAVGLVPVTAIFAAAASLALTPEDEGIQMPD